MKSFSIVVSAGEKELRNLNRYDCKDVDVLEVRLDICSIPFLEKEIIPILKSWNKSILFTYRLPQDSGLKEFTILTKNNVRSLLSFFENESNFLDIELYNPESIFQDFFDSAYTKILSYHNFQKTLSLSEMQNWIESDFSKKFISKKIYKFAVMGNNLEDSHQFMKDIQFISKDQRMIGIVMGKYGKYSRVFGDVFGSLMTYCSLEEPKAPGQLQPTKLIEIRKEFDPIQESKNNRYLLLD